MGVKIDWTIDGFVKLDEEWQYDFGMEIGC